MNTTDERLRNLNETVPTPLRDLLVQILEACPVPYVVQDDAKEALSRVDDAVKHLRAVAARHSEFAIQKMSGPVPWCNRCEDYWPCSHRREIDAALAALVGDNQRVVSPDKLSTIKSSRPREKGIDDRPDTLTPEDWR